MRELERRPVAATDGAQAASEGRYDVSGFPPQARVVLRALKEYGMLVADNGSNWFISGEPDPRWSNDDLHTLHGVPGSAFEVVDPSMLIEILTGSSGGPRANPAPRKRDLTTSSAVPQRRPSLHDAVDPAKDEMSVPPVLHPSDE